MTFTEIVLVVKTYHYRQTVSSMKVTSLTTALAWAHAGSRLLIAT